MLVTIITPTPDDISAFGVRSLSSYLKGFGYKTRIIFLPGSIKKSDPQGKYMYQYSTRTLDEVSDLVKGSCLIGISFMTYYFDRAVQLTKVLKQQCKTPIIWGGIHATVRPKEALKYADMVCVGEGEETLLELARKIENGENYFQVKNLWLKENGHIIKNSLRPLIKDLDSLPFFDYSLEEHYCFDYARGHIREIDDALFQELLPVRPDLDGNFRVCYRTMTDRGCPHKCTYCSISIQKELYEGEGFFRKRKVDGVIEELRCILNRFPFVKTIQFFDDTFFARNTAEIEKFSALYKQHVGLPFHAQCSPRTITERKLQSLVDAGLIFTEMGIQTGSMRIKALYNRTESNAETIEAARIIHKYKNKLLPPDYHVILNNP
ncbi:MAG: radical SAM protein, partial [Desulforhabdus sp.]|nr:radical SAM protein [Desulforhabdus sp.]